MIVHPLLFAFGIWLLVVCEKPDVHAKPKAERDSYDLWGERIARWIIGTAGLASIYFSIT